MVDWNETISLLPGVYLSDQQPQGSGLAASIERIDDLWQIHYAKETPDGLRFYKSKPLHAFHVYETLKAVYKEIGYYPQLTESEQAALQLPDEHDCIAADIYRKLPGFYLGKKAADQNTMAWGEAHYSVEMNGDGTYSLFSCIDPLDEDAVLKPEVDKLGEYTLPDLMDELRLVGFKPEGISYLTCIQGPFEELASHLPGHIIKNAQFDSAGQMISVLQRDEDQWCVISTERMHENKYRLVCHDRLAPKDVYKCIFQILSIIPCHTDIAKIGLPPMTKVFEDSLLKKMKGELLKGPLAQAGEEQGEFWFVSIRMEKQAYWHLHLVRASHLLEGGRKVQVEKLGPYHVEALSHFLHDLEAYVDPLDLMDALEESKFAEYQELAKQLLKCIDNE